jgi:hypothetical protein
LVEMTEQSTVVSVLSKQLDSMRKMGVLRVILGLVGSTLLLVASTWGLLGLLSLAGVSSLTPEKTVPYTSVMLIGSLIATVVALFLCVLIVRHPKSVNLALRMHRAAKHGTGEYFLSPEPMDQTWSSVLRRSLYGSVLVVGIALTVISFDMMVVVETLDIVRVGTTVMIISVIVLPLTLMQFYYGPWVVKDAGLFHLDEKDRSLSNVGDDLEDILEFFAGVDIILVWLELTLNTGLEAAWLPIFVILVPLGPLFSIVLNFTLVFMLFKNRVTLSMIDYLSRERGVPDMISSPDYIRSRVLSVIEREILSPVEGSAPEALAVDTAAAEPILSESPMETSVEDHDVFRPEYE